jgi:succinate dehydrogenase / fumarate reductase cytochrome b subunit
MAITGIMLLGFVLAHMIGNWKVFLGKEHLNTYGEWLRDVGEPAFPRSFLLWVLRIGLIGAFAGHIVAAYQLTRMNRKARPVRYQSKRDYVAANFASRTMRWTGIIVALFIIFHLADLTWGWFNPDFIRGQPYHNLVESLSRVPVAIVYIVANIALGVHLYHGAWSLFQSMGWNRPRFNRWRRGFAIGFATLIVVGNVSFPIAVLAGIVGN